MDLSITGIGSYLPKNMLSNEALPPLDKPITPEEIEKIGIHRRGWAGEGESIPEMAAEAAKRALAKANLEAEALDFIILANWTQRRFIPDFAPKLQSLLGAKRAFAFDVSTACAGFVYGVAIAHGFLQNDRFSRALVVASETTSRRARPRSKSTLVFGDAAGAFVLEKNAGRGGKLLGYELMTDGSRYEAMEIDEAGHVVTKIEQKELNQLATRSFMEASTRCLERCGVKKEELDWVVPHSGTAGIQASFIRALEVPKEKVLTNFSTIGNASSAAIPAALDQFIGSGKISPGDLILSPTTGTGWYAAAMVYTV
jgi:3-oxoacyl-[acyl-carrier-protein] synthase III